jgi:hypothetical protein
MRERIEGRGGEFAIHTSCSAEQQPNQPQKQQQGTRVYAALPE